VVRDAKKVEKHCSSMIGRRIMIETVSSPGVQWGGNTWKRRPHTFLH